MHAYSKMLRMNLVACFLLYHGTGRHIGPQRGGKILLPHGSQLLSEHLEYGSGSQMADHTRMASEITSNDSDKRWSWGDQFFFFNASSQTHTDILHMRKNMGVSCYNYQPNSDSDRYFNILLTLPETKSSPPWKMVVGRRSSPFDALPCLAYFQAWTVNSREGT